MNADANVITLIIDQTRKQFIIKVLEHYGIGHDFAAYVTFTERHGQMGMFLLGVQLGIVEADIDGSRFNLKFYPAE